MTATAKPSANGTGTHKKVVMQLKLSQLRRDGGTQSRYELNSDTANHYAEVLKEGAVFPPVTVFYDGKHYWLASGFHRWSAHDIAGRKTIECDVREGSLRDAILFSVGCNHQHGLQRTHKDKRKACRMLLEDEEWWDKADRWLADKCHVSPHLVAAVREDMEEEWAEEERKRQEKESAATTASATASTDTTQKKDGSLCGAHNENGRPRVGRTRHGKTTRINTANQGKGKKGVKPVYVETDPKQLRKIERQAVRSLPKWLRQWKRLGKTREEAHAELDRVWDEIPVED